MYFFDVLPQPFGIVPPVPFLTLFLCPDLSPGHSNTDGRHHSPEGECRVSALTDMCCVLPVQGPPFPEARGSDQAALDRGFLPAFEA